MKKTHLIPFLILALLVTLGSTGCRRKPKGVISIPGRTGPTMSQAGEGTGRGLPFGTPRGIDSTNIDPTEGDPLAPRPENTDRDTAALAAATVYFGFDRAEITEAERAKLNTVADYLNGNNRDMLMVEGHCDERGTEGYNQALGARRAQTLRDELVALGVDASRIQTTSLGESQPEDPGQNEAAYSRNRRGVFVVLKGR